MTATEADHTVNLSVPTITGPAAVTTDPRPTITWSNDPGASGYEIWIKNTSTGQNPYLVTTSSTNSFTPSEDPGIGVYDIWVRSYRTGGIYGGWSARYRTQIIAPVTIAEEHEAVDGKTDF